MPVNFDSLCNEQNLSAKCERGCAFLLSNARLIEFTNNDEALLGSLVYLDMTKTIRRGKSPKAGYLLACPVCNTIHIEGFEESSVVVEDTSVHRKITVGAL